MPEKRADLVDLFTQYIEAPFVRVMKGRFEPGYLAGQLTSEVEGTFRKQPDETIYVADQYTITLSPQDIADLHVSVRGLQKDLTLGLETALHESGFALVHEPHLTLATDPTLKPGEARVIAWFSSNPLDLTEEVSAPGEKITTEMPPPGAFFVIEGSRHFALKQPVINIGRLVDNDLILEDNRISRRHAQLRARQGIYMIKDLHSTAGTRVNDEFVNNERRLVPGDVVSLATVEMVYGQDDAGPPDQTPPYESDLEPPDEQELITPLDLSQTKTQELEPDDEDYESDDDQ